MRPWASVRPLTRAMTLEPRRTTNETGTPRARAVPRTTQTVTTRRPWTCRVSVPPTWAGGLTTLTTAVALSEPTVAVTRPRPAAVVDPVNVVEEPVAGASVPSAGTESVHVTGTADGFPNASATSAEKRRCLPPTTTAACGETSIAAGAAATTVTVCVAGG